MTKYFLGCVVGLSVLASSCERKGGVKVEIEDLHTGQVSESLQEQLIHARAEVVRLEQQLALSQQSVTDEALMERQSRARTAGDMSSSEQLMTARDTQVRPSGLASHAGKQPQVRTEAILPPTPLNADEGERASLEHVNVSGRDEAPRTTKNK